MLRAGSSSSRMWAGAPQGSLHLACQGNLALARLRPARLRTTAAQARCRAALSICTTAPSFLVVSHDLLAERVPNPRAPGRVRTDRLLAGQMWAWRWRDTAAEVMGTVAGQAVVDSHPRSPPPRCQQLRPGQRWKEKMSSRQRSRKTSRGPRTKISEKYKPSKENIGSPEIPTTPMGGGRLGNVRAPIAPGSAYQPRTTSASTFPDL